MSFENNPHFDSMKFMLEQATGGKNSLIFDDVGMPSTMVRIPKFQVADVLPGGSATTHPMFKVEGVEVNAIWISKYQNIIENGRAYSRAGADPANYIDFDTAKAACEAKGKGWHLMSLAEWGGITAWCMKNGYQPRGNTNYGEAHGAAWEHGYGTYKDGDHEGGRTAAGTGPVSWYHDGSGAGIADLVGNVWEWVSGMRMVDGEIQIIPDNDSAAAVNEGESSAKWRALTSAGALVTPGTANTLHYDFVSSKIHLMAGNPTNTADSSKYCSFRDMSTALSTVPEICKVLNLYPTAYDTSYANGGHWYNASGERLPLAGGSWTSTSRAGLGALDLSHPRSHRWAALGFRAAYVEL